MQNSNKSYSGLVEKFIGTAYDTVKFVADHMDEVEDVKGVFASYQGILQEAPLLRRDGEPLRDGDIYVNEPEDTVYIIVNSTWYVFAGRGMTDYVAYIEGRVVAAAQSAASSAASAAEAAATLNATQVVHDETEVIRDEATAQAYNSLLSAQESAAQALYSNQQATISAQKAVEASGYATNSATSASESEAFKNTSSARADAALASQNAAAASESAAASSAAASSTSAAAALDSENLTRALYNLTGTEAQKSIDAAAYSVIAQAASEAAQTASESSATAASSSAATATASKDAAATSATASASSATAAGTSATAAATSATASSTSATESAASAEEARLHAEGIDLSTKADLAGSATQVFKVAEPVDNSDAATKNYVDALGGGGGGGGDVTKVFNRIGEVVATTGDYTIAQITDGISAADVATNIATAVSPKADSADVATDIATAVATKADTAGVATQTFSVAEPTIDAHAATKKYVDDNAGGGGSGDLLADGSVGMDAGYVPTADQAIATKKYIDDNIPSVPPAAPVDSVHGRTGAVVAVTGDYDVAEVTGAASVSAMESADTLLAQGINTKANLAGSSSQAFSVGAPSVDAHAATKKYVDDNAGGGGGGNTLRATHGSGLVVYDESDQWHSGTSVMGDNWRLAHSPTALHLPSFSVSKYKGGDRVSLFMFGNDKYVDWKAPSESRLVNILKNPGMVSRRPDSTQHDGERAEYWYWDQYAGGGCFYQLFEEGEYIPNAEYKLYQSSATVDSQKVKNTISPTSGVWKVELLYATLGSVNWLSTYSRTPVLPTQAITTAELIPDYLQRSERLYVDENIDGITNKVDFYGFAGQVVGIIRELPVPMVDKGANQPVNITTSELTNITAGVAKLSPDRSKIIYTGTVTADGRATMVWSELIADYKNFI